MKTEITFDISRLNLHDSSFETVIRYDRELELIFDWSKFENLKEQDINEPIIIGKTRMFLTGLNLEEFKLFDGNSLDTFIIIPALDDDIIKDIDIISLNEIDDDNKKVKISGLYSKNEALQWFEWSFHFDTCKLSWNSHITMTEWLNGKMTAD